MLLSFTASNWVDMRQTAMGSRSPWVSSALLPAVVGGCAAMQWERTKFPRGEGIEDINPRRCRPRSPNVGLNLKSSFTWLAQSCRSSATRISSLRRLTGQPSSFSTSSGGTSGSRPSSVPCSPAGGAALLRLFVRGLLGLFGFDLAAARPSPSFGATSKDFKPLAASRFLAGDSTLVPGRGPSSLFLFPLSCLSPRTSRPPSGSDATWAGSELIASCAPRSAPLTPSGLRPSRPGMLPPPGSVPRTALLPTSSPTGRAPVLCNVDSARLLRDLLCLGRSSRELWLWISARGWCGRSSALGTSAPARSGSMPWLPVVWDWARSSLRGPPPTGIESSASFWAGGPSDDPVSFLRIPEVEDALTCRRAPREKLSHLGHPHRLTSHLNCCGHRSAVSGPLHRGPCQPS